jgi:hypothetical protein
MSAPIFARRHYQAVAAVLRDAGYLEPEARGQLVTDLVELFAADNGRFKPDRFRAAVYAGVKLGSSELVLAGLRR